MQRLTEKADEYFHKGGIKYYPKDKGLNKSICNKLGEYEDLEEQGLLLRLPCRIGDVVWCVEEYDDGAEYGEYIFAGICGEFVLVAVSYNDDEFEEKLEEMREDTKSYGVAGDICVFHISNLFLTEEEAEAKLREMEVEE